MALHIPWDKAEDYGALRRYAEDLGVRRGPINSNTFQDEDYKLGRLTDADPSIRKKAVKHNLECIDIMYQTGSRDLKIWLADGTNDPTSVAFLRGRETRGWEILRRSAISGCPVPCS